jgi:hypothetical protein
MQPLQDGGYVARAARAVQVHDPDHGELLDIAVTSDLNDDWEDLQR